MSKRRRGIDGWMYQELVKIVGRDLKVGKNTSKDYKRGVDIHGLNNISGDARPNLMKGWSRLGGFWHDPIVNPQVHQNVSTNFEVQIEPTVLTYGRLFSTFNKGKSLSINPFRLSTDDEPQTIHDILPPDIVKRLLSLKEVSKAWKYSDKCVG
jgi:hypothetical protein